MSDWPPIGSVWHRGAQERTVLEHDTSGGRVRWSGPHRKRWCKLDSWIRWAKYAKEGPAPEAPTEPETLRDLGRENAALRGVLAPPRPTAPIRLREGVRGAWRAAVGECLARGVELQAISDALGITVPQVHVLVRELRESFEDLGGGVWALRRERLWWEACELEARLTEHLLACAPGETDPRAVAALAKTLLEAQKHRAMLAGAMDAPTTQVNVGVNVGAPQDPVQLAVQRFGLDPAQLAAVGDGLAEQLTVRARAVIEAEHDAG